MTSSFAFDAICWDFDGTTVDTESQWGVWMAEQWRELFGMEVSRDFLDSLVGSSMERTIAMTREATGTTHSAEVIADDLVARAQAGYRSMEIPWMPGARELFAEADAAGIPQALVTATHADVLYGMVDRMGLSYATVVSGDRVSQGKPHPESYLLACQELGVDPRRALVLEDSVNGADAGNAAGCVVLTTPGLVTPPPAPRRRQIDTLAGRTLADLDAFFREAAND